jgi:hypothetical protein
MDLNKLAAQARADLGDPATWVEPPGYPDSLALAVIDAIQSLGVRYTSVENVIARYRSYRRDAGADPNTDNAADLVATFDELGGARAWADTIGNQNRTSTAGGPLKAVAILEGAQLLVENGLLTGPDVLRDVARSDSALKAQWLSIPGQRYGTSWAYLLILLGAENVKPDRMIQGWLSRHLPGEERRLSAEQASAAVSDVAALMGVSTRLLDHAIWRFEQQTREREATQARAIH